MVILDAAVLLEAGWESLCDEVWCVIVPRSEAVRRLRQRQAGLSETEAEARVSAQLSVEARVAASSVVLCSLWDKSVTRAQIDKAWRDLTASRSKL